MSLLIGTTGGVFVADAGSAPVAAKGLDGRNVRALCRANGGLLAGTDDGVHRSADGGRAWERVGLEGATVWDVAAAPADDHVVYAGTSPPALFRSRDGGASWAEVELTTKVPGADRWCLPNNPYGGRARTILFDPAKPDRLRLGIEVGGICTTDDGGETWSYSHPGDNTDIHNLMRHPTRPNVVYATTGRGRLNDDVPYWERVVGVFLSEDDGESWRYIWEGVEPRYTRPICVDPRAPNALTVAAAPTAFSKFTDDDGGAKAMLYQSADGGGTWRSLCDEPHTPSAANPYALLPAPDAPGAVLMGTDSGEVWRITPDREWTLLASGLPWVQVLRVED